MKRIFAFFSFAALACSALTAPAFAQITAAPAATDAVRIVRSDANGVGTNGTVAVSKLFDTAGRPAIRPLSTSP